MYTTCLFCHAPLGANDAVEAFPVGRRLAFDAAHGRLWVVCRKCARWNLTPLEERWEAIETCETLFRATTLRVSTDNIGLARVQEGLELVRIGSALRPEVAAWRYGDQFGKRRRRRIAYTAAATVATGGLIVAGPIMGAIVGGAAAVQIASSLYEIFDNRRVRARLRLPNDPDVLELRRSHLQGVSLRADADAWRLRIPYGSGGVGDIEAVTLAGDDALRAARSLLPAINTIGADRRRIQRAVGLIEETPDPYQLFRGAAITSGGLGNNAAAVADLPVEVRLALEMAAHEETERRAFAGELAQLAAAWREAEEIAAIADALLIPDQLDRRLQTLRNSQHAVDTRSSPDD